MPLQAKPMGGQLKATPPPSNPKYAKIKAKLDTGYNELKMKTSDLKANARFHRGENFRRLKVSGLIAVLQDPVVDVLLLDLRDEDAFAQYHVTGAVNYPIRLLSRQVNPFTAEILAYINGAPEKIIVLIDLDEHMACNAGNSFYEKQVDNVYVVTGGLKAVIKMAPELCEGSGLPLPTPSPTRPSTSWSLASSVSQASVARPGQGYTPTGNIRPRSSASRLSKDLPQHWKQ